MLQGAMPTIFGAILLYCILIRTLQERSHEQSKAGPVSSFTSELTEVNGHTVTQLISGEFRTTILPIFFIANLLISTILGLQPKTLTVQITTNWKILKEMGIPDHLSCLLRNRHAGQEATVRTGHGTTDWFQIGKGVHQVCILSPCLFNLYAEYIM